MLLVSKMRPTRGFQPNSSCETDLSHLPVRPWGSTASSPRTEEPLCCSDRCGAVTSTWPVEQARGWVTGSRLPTSQRCD